MDELEFNFRSTLKYLRATDESKIQCTSHRYMAGLVEATAVRLWKLEDDDMLDGVEITYYVQVCGNPDRVVFVTGDAGQAHVRFGEEITAWRARAKANSKFGSAPREL